MNKTTTRFILSGLLLLSHLLVLAQYPEINQVPSNPVLVCPDGNGQSARIIKIAPNPTGESFVYEYGSDPTWSCCLAQNQLEYTFHVPQTGALIELRRKYFIGGNFVYQTLGQYYSPVTPRIDAPPYPSSCSAASGRIVVTDLSTNFAAMPRLFKIYNANNILLDTARVNSATHPFNNLPPGTYKVVIETFCNNIIAERSGIVVPQISQNPGLEIALSGHDDCLSNNINASVVLPESIPTAGVQYRMDGGTWQASNTFTNVTPWLSHQFSARLSGCFDASTTHFVSELSIPRIESLERAKDTDCTPANNEIQVFVPEGSDAQIQFNHSGGWYNPGQWVGPLPDGTLHIRARSAYLPSCYRDTSITLSEHGSVSLIGADASNLTDCTLNNIGLQLRTEPAVSTGLEYFVEGKGWQSSAQFSGLSNGDKRIAIRSTGLCQLGVAADTLTLSEIIAPQIESIAPQGHDDCVVGNAGFWVYLVQSVSGVKFRINGGAWQPGNLFQNRPAGNYLIEAARADGTCVSSQNYALVETGSVAITGLSKANENDCVVGNARFQVLHTGGNQQGLKFRLNGGAWQDSAIFRNLTRMAVNVEAQIQKPSCTSSIVAWPDSIREQSNFPEIASVTITGDKNCTVGATVTFSLKVPMTATYWLSSTKNNTTGVFTGLSSGTYTFQVYKTANGCVQTRVVTIDEKLNFTLDSLRVQGGDDCLNNNAVVTIYHPYGNNYGLQFREVTRNTAWQNSNAFPLSTHGVGQYNLEARNVNGCTLWSGSIYGQERLNPEITGVLGIDGLSDCSLGNVTAQVQLLNSSAGTAKQYRVNGRPWTLSSTLSGFRHGANLVELNYDFGGIGTKQCTISRSIVIDEKAKEITGVLLDAATLNDCSLNNVKATIQVDGGTSNLRYVVTGKTEGTSNIFTNLNNGQYRAIIRDVVSTCRDTMVFNVAETPALALPTPTIQNVVCFGAATGSISTSPTGGIASYTYLWSTGATSANIRGLAAGTYSVTVSDTRGCSLSQTLQVTGPAQSNLPQISFTGDTSICKGASFSVSASGGGAYSWNTGATSSTISGSPENTTTYTVTVTNGLGCSASASRIIKVNALPVPNIEGINKICVGQSTTLTATGGSSYAWQHGPTGANISVNPSSTTTYKVTVTNQAQCSAIYNRTVIVNANPVAEILGLPSTPVCGDSTLTLTASGIGAYSWNTGETSTTIQPLITGKRSVVLVVKNANACADTAQAEILFNTRPVAQILGGDIACYGNSTVLTAGLATSYRWNTGATSASINIVAPLQTATYTVTLSNGLGCSVSAEKIVKVPDTLSLSYQLDKDQDCIAKNVSIIPQASGGQGSKTFTLLRSGELYPYSNLSGWGSGEYALVVKDSLECVATKALKILETPVKISKVNVLGTDDCVAGNTQLVIETEGNRLPLVYRLNGQLVNGPEINLPRMPGQYLIEVSDSLGCVAREEKYYPAYDSLVITSSSISACDLVDGSIQLSYEGTDASKLNFSIDGGMSWHPASTTFNQLGKGVYLPKVKLLDSGCEINGDSIFISSPDCFPLAAFTKDTLYVRNPEQEVVLPWRIERNGYQDTLDYTLRIGREGDGKPHFTDPNVHTLNENRLRSANPILFQDYAFDFAGGADSLVLPLQDSAQLYRSPAAYVFQLETTPESPLRVDPLHGRLIVYVNFTDSVIIERKEVVLCPGMQQVTLGEDLGEDYCYAWEGPVSSNLPLLTISPTQNGEYKLNIIRNKDFKIYKIIIYSVKVESKQVQIESSGTVICEGASKLLSLKFSDGGAIDPLSWVIGWEDGSSGVPRVVQPQFSTTYRVILVNQISGCTIEDTLRMEVLEKPKYVKILPEVASICGQLPGVELELEAWPLRTDVLNYFWSNGVNDYKTKVTKPGTYYVEVAHKSLRSCATRFYRQVEDGMKVAISVDSSQVLCPETLLLSAKVLNPISGMNYTFNWSTGASTQSIVLEPGVENYTVTVSTSGGACSGSQSQDVSPYLNKLLSDQQGKFLQKMTALGFSSVACKIVPIAVSPKPDLRSQEGVEDYAGNVTIEIEGARFNLNQRLTRVVSSYRSRGLYAKGLITPGCPEDVFDEKFTQYRADQEYNDIILRVVKNAEPGGDDQLFVFVESDSMRVDDIIDALKDETVEPRIVIPKKEFMIAIRNNFKPANPAFFCTYGGQTAGNQTLGDSLISVALNEHYKNFGFKFTNNCLLDGKQLKDGYSFTGEMIYNDIGKNENFLGNPIANHKATWMLNGQIIQDTTFNFGIYYTHHESLMHEGMNTLTLVVVSRATKQTIATVSIQIMGYKRYSADKIRVVANWNGMQGYLNNSQYLGDASRGLEPILVGTNIDFSLQVLQDTTWMVLSDVDWKHHDSLSQKSSQLTFNCIESYQSPEKITASHPRIITDKIVFGVYQKNDVQKVNFKLPYIDNFYKPKDSIKIVEAYKNALEQLEKKNKALYSLLDTLNISVKIVNSDHAEFKESPTTFGHTDTGVSIFMENLDIDNEIVDIISKPGNTIIQDARLIVKLSMLEQKNLIGQVLKGETSKFTDDLITLLRSSNPKAADSLRLALSLKDPLKVPNLEKFAYEVANNNLDRFRQLRNGPVVIYLNWTRISDGSDGTPPQSMKKTIAHELIHASYPYDHPLVAMKWKVIRATLARRKVKWILGDQLGMNGRNGCSQGIGHEWYNPENVDSCAIEKK